MLVTSKQHLLTEQYSSVGSSPTGPAGQVKSFFLSRDVADLQVADFEAHEAHNSAITSRLYRNIHDLAYAQQGQQQFAYFIVH